MKTLIKNLISHQDRKTKSKTQELEPRSKTQDPEATHPFSLRCGLRFFVDCGHGGAGMWVLIMVVVAVGGLGGGELSRLRWVWWVLISNGEYRGFLYLLVAVFVFVCGFFFVFAGGCCYFIHATIDDDGSLWCLLEPHGCFDFLLLPSIRGGGWGLCWVWFFGFEKWEGFQYGVKGFGLVFKRVLDLCN